jgi:hypothetical protein
MRPPDSYLRWLSFLVVASVAAVGVERFDFLWWSGPFVFTPSVLIGLALCATVVVGLVRRWIAFRWRFGFAVLVALVVVALLSVLVNSSGTVGLGRTGLFALAIGAAWLSISVAALLGRFDLARLGAWIGLAVFVLTAAVQQVMFLAGVGGTVLLGPLDLTISQLGAELSRTTGTTTDPNRACLTLSLLAVLLLARLPAVRRLSLRTQIAAAALLSLLALTTWSRSGLVLFAIVIVGVWIAPLLRGLSRRAALIIAGSFAGGIVVAVVIAVVAAPGMVEHLIMTRLVIQPGDSASEHFTLLELALQVIVEHPLVLLTGIGFGMSFTVLSDAGIPSMATAGDHANFHSAYSTLTIETGLIGLALFLILLLRPIATRWAAISIGLVLFCIVYQSLMDVGQWMLLAIAWTVSTDVETTRERSILLFAEQPEREAVQ